MNQIKIGRFIAECRKKENLTQMQLAKKLGAYCEANRPGLRSKTAAFCF